MVSRADGKAAIVVGVTADLAGRFDAVELVRVGAEALGGKGGGGRADMAQAGGPEAGQAQAALDAVERAVAAKAQAGLHGGSRLNPDSPVPLAVVFGRTAPVRRVGSSPEPEMLDAIFDDR